jgi:hypothetical protein
VPSRTELGRFAVGENISVKGRLTESLPANNCDGPAPWSKFFNGDWNLRGVTTFFTGEPSNVFGDILIFDVFVFIRFVKLFFTSLSNFRILFLATF